MRLSCPTCQTEYEVPDAALTGRTRKLRCATCGNQWEAGPIGGSEPDAAPTPAEIAYMQRPRATVPSNVNYGGPAQSEDENFGQTYAPPVPVGRAVQLPAPPDPADVRQQADRESFAALLEASRQTGAQNSDLTSKDGSGASRKLPNPWLTSILILLLVAALIFLEREHIMAVWPPSIRLFAALGLK